MGYQAIIAGRLRTIDTEYDNFAPSSSVSDRVPTLDMHIVDANSTAPVRTSDEIVILDDNQPNGNTANLLLNPLFLGNVGGTVLPQPPNIAQPTLAWTFVEPSGTTISTTAAPVGQYIVIDANNTPSDYTNVASVVQYTQPKLIADATQYCLSAYMYVGTALLTNCTLYLRMTFYSGLAPTRYGAGGRGGGSYLGEATQTFTRPAVIAGHPAPEVRVNVQGTAPQGTRYIAVDMGLYPIDGAQSYSGHVQFRSVQLEPMWFPDMQNYPTPDCNQNDTLSYVLPNSLTIRQNRVFAGIVTNSDIVEYDGTSRIWDIGTKGAGYLLQAKYVSGTYSNQYDSDLLTFFVSQQLAGQLSTNGVTQGAYISDDRVYDDISLEEICNDFANTSGFTYYVDPYYDLKYLPLGAVYAPARLSDMDSEIDNVTVYPYQDWTCPRDLTQLANDVIVHGATFTRTLTDPFTGNGTTNAFVLTEPNPREVISVYVNTTQQTVGVYGKDSFSQYQVLVDFPNHRVLFQNAPSSGASVKVNYVADSQIKVEERDVASIARYRNPLCDGVFRAKINDTNITTTQGASQRALQELAQRAYELITPKFRTYLPLVAGMTVRITNSTEENADGTPLNQSPFLVNKVAIHILGGEVIEYECECGADIPMMTRVNKRLHHSTARSKRLAGAPVTQYGVVIHDSVTIQEQGLVAVVNSYARRPGG